MSDDIVKGAGGLDDLAGMHLLSGLFQNWALLKLVFIFDSVGSTLVDDGGLVISTGDGSSHKDELTDFLSSIDTGLPSMDSKDVEDIFKGVLTDDAHAPSDSMFPLAAGVTHQPPPTTPSTPGPISTGILIPPNIAASASAPPGQEIY